MLALKVRSALTASFSLSLITKNVILAEIVLKHAILQLYRLQEKEISVKDALAEIEKDKSFYYYSNGGVTLSGGESLLQPKFAKEILKACKANGLTTTIETAAFVSLDSIKEVLPYVDTFLVDIN